MRVELSIFADYKQFYLQDEPAKGNLGDAWTDDALGRLLAVAPGTVGVGTVRDVEVPVTVGVLEAEPPSDFAGYDLVTEASLEVTSGRIVVAGCTDFFPDARRIEVSPGRYRVRVHYGNLSTVGSDGLTGDDSYRVVLWRESEVLEPRILHDRRGLLPA